MAISAKKETKALEKQISVLWDLTLAQRENPLSLKEEVNRILLTAADFLQASRVSIWLFQNNNKLLHCFTLLNQNRQFEHPAFNFDSTLHPQYIKTCIEHRYICVEDVTTSPFTEEFRESYLSDNHILSFMNVSLYLGAQIKGILCFEDSTQTRQWTEEDLNFARAISNRVNLSLANQEREENLSFERSLENSQRNTIVITPWGTIEKSNKSAEALFGYSSEQLRKKNINDLLPGIMESKYISIDIFNDHESPESTLTATAVNYDKKAFPVELFISQIAHWNGQYILIVLTDIREKVKKTKQLEDSEHLYRSLIDDQIDPIIRVIPGGAIIFANNGFCKLFKTSKEVATSKSIYDYTSAEDQDIFLSHIAKLTPEEPLARYSHNVTIEDGTKRVINWATRALYDKQNQISSYQVIGRDLTQERTRENKLRKNQRLEALAVLAGGMAHDFNNLLSPILSFTDIALTTLPQSSMEVSYLKFVMEAANRAKELTRMVLTFSRQEERNDRTPINAGPLIQEVLDFTQNISSTRVKLHQKVDPNCGVVIAHPSDLYQIITNLFTNAIQAMPAGGDLYVSGIQIHKHNRPYLQIEVRDTGEGIRPEFMEHLFEPFFTTRPRGQGTGLGLAVVKGLVEELGGEIDYQSEPDHGAAFVIYLPNVEQGKLDTHTNPDQHLLSGQETILLVDDDENITNSIRDSLSQLGYSILVRSSGEEAFSLVTSSKHNIDLVITDYTMPHITGLELSKKIKEYNKQLPIILISGYGRLLKAAELESCGIESSIQKPFLPEELATLIRKTLNQESRNE